MMSLMFFFSALLFIALAGTAFSNMEGKKRFSNEASRRLGLFSSTPEIVSKDQQGKMEFWEQRQGKDIEYLDKVELHNALEKRGTSLHGLKDYGVQVDDSDSVDSSEADVIRGVLKSQPIQSTTINAEVSGATDSQNNVNSATQNQPKIIHRCGIHKKNASAVETSSGAMASSFNSLNSATTASVIKPNGDVFSSSLPTHLIETTNGTHNNTYLIQSNTVTVINETTNTLVIPLTSDKVKHNATETMNASNVSITASSTSESETSSTAETNTNSATARASYPPEFSLEIPETGNTNTAEVNSLENDANQKIDETEKETATETAKTTETETATTTETEKKRLPIETPVVIPTEALKIKDSDKEIDSDRSNAQTTETAHKKTVLKCVEVYED